MFLLFRDTVLNCKFFYRVVLTNNYTSNAQFQKGNSFFRKHLSSSAATPPAAATSTAADSKPDRDENADPHSLDVALAFGKSVIENVTAVDAKPPPAAHFPLLALNLAFISVRLGCRGGIIGISGISRGHWARGRRCRADAVVNVSFWLGLV